MDSPGTVTLHSLADTAALGGRIAAELRAGDVVALCGGLGAGKTHLCQAITAALGSPANVSSPTFTLVQEYRGGRLPLYHADLYRLPEGVSLDDLGLDEVAEDGVLAIEWPERLARPVPGAVAIRIAIDDDTARTITIDAPPAA